MFKSILLLCLISLVLTFNANAQTNAIVGNDVVFSEENGLVAVEAEHFFKQSKTDVRQWYRHSKNESPVVGRDDDGQHCKGASNNSYLEILPDTRVTHGDVLTGGVNFTNTPGEMCIVHYKVNFQTTGRYYVWVRAHSTGSEDNGLHVGIDGEWPATGARLQWCEGKQSWRWESKQRTDAVHCGEPYLIYLDIEEPGEHEIHFSMREDGFEFDKFIMTTDKNYVANDGVGPEVKVKSGKLPKPFPVVNEDKKALNYTEAVGKISHLYKHYIKATDFPIEGTKFYKDNSWLAINPNDAKEATASLTFDGEDINCDIVILGVGENDGGSSYTLSINDKPVESYKAPLSLNTYEEGARYCKMLHNSYLKKGDKISITAKIGSADGNEYSRGRWAGIVIAQADKGAPIMQKLEDLMGKKEGVAGNVIPEITGELKKWHKVTLTFDGPQSSEIADENPFMDYRFNVTFAHKESGKTYLVPGYFAADGNAGNTSATEGNKWRVHFAPDETGEWTYNVDFRKGKWVAVSDRLKSCKSAKYMDQSHGSFKIDNTDKTGRDNRGKGRLQYVGERYLKFAETGHYMIKVGSDAPENMLSYEEFDGTFHNDGHKDDLVKTWEAHEKHWNEGDPTWKDGKGKDIIGAVNYLASKGLNAFSFLTMNIGGDDQNVFPYIDYYTYDRIDCSKMDQWEVLFEHADKLGMFLHFKTLEFENQGLLDNGGVGAFSKLYYRELMARFGHHLALNWNLCEETGDWAGNLPTPPQFKWERISMAAYFGEHDPYKHHIVIHNGDWYDPIYGETYFTGASLQTSREDFSSVHGSTLKILNDSKKAGKQWAVACDEPGDHRHSLIPDDEDPDHDNARKNGLWGNLMAGGWGTEWYFGYAHPHSDLTCQDYASRDLFWDQGRIAIEFFEKGNFPYWEMENHNELILKEGDYCLAKPGEVYVFFLKDGQASVDLSAADGKLTVEWYNPRKGGDLQSGSKKKVKAGNEVDLGNPPVEDGKDWVVIVR